MKINLPFDIIVDMLACSPKFREFVAASLVEGDRDKVIVVFKHFLKNKEKINAIKTLRDWTRGNRDNLMLVKNSFPNEFASYGFGDEEILSLTAAKHIVEIFEV